MTNSIAFADHLVCKEGAKKWLKGHLLKQKWLELNIEVGVPGQDWVAEEQKLVDENPIE